MSAQSTRVCPVDGLVLAELVVQMQPPTWVLYNARSVQRGRRLGWRCTVCNGPADALPPWARRRGE